MAKREKRGVPAYKRHPNGQAYVYHRSIVRPRHVLYLGVYGSDESLRRYRAFLSQLEANSTRQSRSTPLPLASDATMIELVAAYLSHCETYYRDADDNPTSEFGCIKTAVAPLVEMFGDDLAAGFSAEHFETYRNRLIADGYARTTINKHASRVRGMFKWGAAKGRVPAGVWHTLQAVGGLKAGRTSASEPPPIPAVSWEQVELALPHFSPVVAAMVSVQFWCGMRPQDVCRLRRCELDASGEIWIYRPPRHKNAWRGHALVKAIPRRVQSLLRERFSDDAMAYLFPPQEAVVWRYGSPRCNIGDCYTTGAYRQAVAYGLAKLNSAMERDGLATVPLWTPMQLRHGIATYLERTQGVQAAQKYLGHRRLETTGLYVEQAASELIRIARQIDERSGMA